MSVGPALLGAIVGIVVGLTSMGGGALLTPGLIYILGIPPAIAVGSDVLIASGTKLFGSGAYAIRREVNWPIVSRLLLGSLPGAFLGNFILNALPKGMLNAFVVYGLGGVLVVVGLTTLYRSRMKALPANSPMPSTAVFAAMGFVTGLLVMMTSVGSGSVLIVMMMRLVPLPMRRLVGTDIVHALVLSSMATVLHAHSGRVDVALALTVLVGAVPGVLIGVRLTGVLPETSLRTVLAAVLVLVGVILLSKGTGASPLPHMGLVSTATATPISGGARP